MRLVTNQTVDQYLKNDKTKSRLDTFSNQSFEEYVCQKWLRDSPAKRCIYESLYGSLFEDEPKKTILDVGGGLTAFTPVLASTHDYFLLDLLAHEQLEEVEKLEETVGRNFIIPKDWQEVDVLNYDTVIANDIFPNVDQRLESFLYKFIPQCSRLKMLLTWYNTPQHYKTKRVDGEEIMFLQAWNGDQTRKALEPFLNHIVDPDLELFNRLEESPFPNGRQTCLIEFQGTQR